MCAYRCNLSVWMDIAILWLDGHCTQCVYHTPLLLLPATSASLSILAWNKSTPTQAASLLTLLPLEVPAPSHQAHKMLVKEIQAMEFVEMCELLLDNLAPAEQPKVLSQHIRQAAHNPEQNEISFLCTWTASMAVVFQVHLDRVVEMLAHMRLIIMKAHRHGGTVKPLKADPPFQR